MWWNACTVFAVYLTLGMATPIFGQSAEDEQASRQLAQQYGRDLDRFVICEVFLARLKLAQGDVTGAAALLAAAGQSARR